MDTTLIYQALEQPALRKAIPIEELERIKAEYPYFTAAQILLAKIYQENNDHRFSDQVQHAAIYAGDRTVLYHYLKQDVSPEARLQDASPAASLRDTLPAEELRDVSPEARLRDDSPVASLRDEVEGVEDMGEVDRDFAVISEDEIEIFGERGGEQELELELEEELEEEELEEELEQEQGATTPNPELRTPNPELRTLNPELDELSRNILIEAVHSSIEMEVGEKENENENENESESESAIDPSTMSFAELMMLRAKKAHYGQDAQPSAGLRDAQPAAELRDTLPAEELRDDSPAASLREEDIEDEEHEEEIDTKSYEYLYKLQNGGLPPLGGTDKREKQRNLIDRFIQTEPKITPGKAAEYSASANVGKDSLEEDFSFATETMAKLFVQQGKLDKARKVYRKLMELHPEKSVYFATQLKNLNQFKK